MLLHSLARLFGASAIFALLALLPLLMSLKESVADQVSFAIMTTQYNAAFLGIFSGDDGAYTWPNSTCQRSHL